MPLILIYGPMSLANITCLWLGDVASNVLIIAHLMSVKCCLVSSLRKVAPGLNVECVVSLSAVGSANHVQDSTSFPQTVQFEFTLLLDVYKINCVFAIV